MTYTVIDVTPDTPEWEQERRNSLGASDMPAVLGLSPYATPLDVYKAKTGAERTFDPLLSFIGHESEPIIEKWVHQFSGVDVELQPAFMARSVEHPFLHASFDRVSQGPFLTWQFKTAHHYTGHKWDEGIPTDIRVQVQTEMLVAGTQRAAVVVWIGGREFRLFWENRDERFIQQHLIPSARDMWRRIVDGNPPDPSTLAELNEVELQPGEEIEASDTAVEMIERRAVLESDIASMREEADAIKVALGNYMGSADTLTRDGRKILTFKYQKGRASFDATALKRDYPHLVNEYTSVGAPFRVMRTIKPKEKK